MCVCVCVCVRACVCVSLCLWVCVCRCLSISIYIQIDTYACAHRHAYARVIKTVHTDYRLRFVLACTGLCVCVFVCLHARGCPCVPVWLVKPRPKTASGSRIERYPSELVSSGAWRKPRLWFAGPRTRSHSLSASAGVRLSCRQWLPHYPCNPMGQTAPVPKF